MTVKTLPRIDYKGKTWFVDMRLNQMRNVDDPNDYIDNPPITMEEEVIEKDGTRIVAFVPHIRGGRNPVEDNEILGTDRWSKAEIQEYEAVKEIHGEEYASKWFYAKFK